MLSLQDPPQKVPKERHIQRTPSAQLVRIGAHRVWLLFVLPTSFANGRDVSCFDHPRPGQPKLRDYQFGPEIQGAPLQVPLLGFEGETEETPPCGPSKTQTAVFVQIVGTSMDENGRTPKVQKVDFVGVKRLTGTPFGNDDPAFS